MMLYKLVGGASRIELNSALHMGGLTPSLATLLKVKERNRFRSYLYG